MCLRKVDELGLPEKEKGLLISNFTASSHVSGLRDFTHKSRINRFPSKELSIC